jgi:response regulator RpfG family c-di-GMP phosphodiesterase
MKALLICNNKDELNLLNGLFKAHFNHVELLCALKTSQALEFLTYEGPFGLVMIDVGMQDVDPNQVAQEILEISGERPLVFLGDKAIIKARIDQSIFEKSECNALLYRPYDLEDFKGVIQSSLDWAREEEFEQSIEEFDPIELLPMKIRSFYLFNKLNYDVYLELTTTKYARVIKATKPFTHAHIHHFARKNVKFLFLKKNEYLRFLEDSAAGLIKSYQAQYSVKKTLGMQIKSALIIQQYLNAVGVTETLLELVANTIERTDIILNQERSLRTILDDFPRVQLDIAEHAILTMYLVQSMSTNLGWNSEITRKKTGLAALLQDCTLDNEDLLKISRLDDPHLEVFSPDERQRFIDHPIRAAELSTYFSGYPETDYLIRQHHELPNGDGFPAKLNANKLTVLSCAFVLASHYMAKLVTSKDRSMNMRYEIFSHFRYSYNMGNFKEPVLALEKSLRS